MTPAARLSAAIEVLDRVLAGGAVEAVLTAWGRSNRYAGSGDRYALRDLVFEALRCRRSFAALGGGLTGRGLVLGLARATGQEALFSGEGHAPAVAFEEGWEPVGAEALDVPEWLAGRLMGALPDYEAVMAAMRRRAPVFLRVNLLRGSVEEAVAALAVDGIVVRLVEWVKTALEVVDNERKVQRSAAFLGGLVELQDASSQAVIEALGLVPGMRVLDYCAGGGGKSLAMAALGAVVDAHDIDARRMRDLPARAERAGVEVRIVDGAAITAGYDVVLMDAPCSGSGSWRRDPQGKWALTEARLTEILAVQAGILDHCAGLGGVLAYATCSLLAEENEGQVAGFLARHPAWEALAQRRFSPLQGGDGFFVALLTQGAGKVAQL